MAKLTQTTRVSAGKQHYGKTDTKSIKSGKQKIVWKFPLERQNFIWLGIGIAVIIIGYLLMSTGITEKPAVLQGKWDNHMAITVAPILLVLGYCVIIPFAILKMFKSKKEDNL